MFVITFPTVGKLQGVSKYVIFIVFRANFMIFTNEYFRFSQNMILVSVILSPKGYKEKSLANIGCT